MSDPLKHECGIAFIRLLKPMQHYVQAHKTVLHGFNKLFLLMEKQHNRGQDGIGIGCTKLKAGLGNPYMFRARSTKREALSRIFGRERKQFDRLVRKELIDKKKASTAKKHFEFAGEILMGHLRYGTSGSFSVNSCQPYIRRSNWPTRSLMLLGNFNMANDGALNDKLIERGQHPVFDTDTQTVLEEIGFHLDEAHTDLYRELRGTMDGDQIPNVISERLDVAQIIRASAENWDGGYVFVGAVGNGDSFIARDPHGIRPCFYYKSEELIAFASERVPLMTVFDAEEHEVHELPAGHVATIKNSGEFKVEEFTTPLKPAPCSFERIYFSRGNDPAIYQERKRLGAALVPQILDAIDGDLKNTVFSYVPNTAEVGYFGMMDELRMHRRREVREEIMKMIAAGGVDPDRVDELIMDNWPRAEKVAHKDIKMRTFISQENSRDHLASHVYDISYGVVNPGVDNLVVIDDSIVRGTTLRKSVLRILSRTNPKKIVIASTAPQIRYPDCYGIDMAELAKFIAFEAAIDLLKITGQQSIIEQTYRRCKEELEKDVADMENCVKAIYAPFSADEISNRISAKVYPQQTEWRGKVEVIFQTIGNLHEAISTECGDWYFTGDYPTPAGLAMVNRSFVNFCEDKGGRAYALL